MTYFKGVPLNTSYPIAIIGAGVSGMTCARRLKASGIACVLFDKARGPGGRMATRRQDEATFDHGAQYFRTRSDAFTAEVARWRSAGAVAPWEGRFGIARSGAISEDPSTDKRWVGTPKMSSLGRYLAQGLDIQLQTRIVSLEGERGGWMLHDEAGHTLGPFECVLISAPGPQAEALFPEGSSLKHRAEELDYAPCWTLMAHYESPPISPWDAIKLSEGPLSWIARDSSKPGRPPGERWVLHASPTWSHQHLEDSADSVVSPLIDAFKALGAPEPLSVQAHRWRYALSIPQPGRPSYFTTEEGLGLMGDGLIQPRVESAWNSGKTLAERIIETL